MKPARLKTPASNAARRLLEKLFALVASPGTPDEGKAAAAKLERLKAKYDFGQRDVSKEGLFSGHFQRAYDAQSVIALDDPGLLTWVKWAIEEATDIKCVMRGSELLAQATPQTAAKLGDIGRTIAEGFSALWLRFSEFPGVNGADRDLFMRGAWDGMMQEQKPLGLALPKRAVAPQAKRKPKKSAVGHVAGVNLHPYAVALDLGRQIRFNVPLPDVIVQLEQLDPKQIAA